MGIIVGLALNIGTAGAGEGEVHEPIGGSGTVTLDAFSRDHPVFDVGAAFGLPGAEVPLGGSTDAADGTVIEARAVEADTGQPVQGWQAVATVDGGQWSGSLEAVPLRPSWLQLEARVQGSAEVTRAAQSFAAGHVIDLWAQSEIHRSVLSGFAYQNATPDVDDDDALQVTFSDATGGSYGTVLSHQFITQADAHTGHLIGLSNMLAAERPGEKFHIVFQTCSGTGVRSLLDDSNPDRQWAQDMLVRAHAYQDGQVPGLAIQSWYNADSGALGTDYGDWWLSAITGLTPEGDEHSLHDHYFSDIYDYEKTRWVIAGPHRFESDSFDNTIPQNRAGLNEAFANSLMTDVAIRGLEPLAYRNGNASGGDPAHPMQNDLDGLSRLMLFMGQGMLQGLGLASFTEVPEFDTATLSGDSTYVTVTSSAGNIITTRSARGEMATLPSGRPEISGFKINGAEAERVEIAGGAARVYYNAAGDAFPAGTVITFGADSIGSETLPDDLTINEVWKDYPLVDLGQAALEGIPVRGLTSPEVLNVIPAAGAPAGYDPAESLMPADNAYSTGSPPAGAGGWANDNGSSGTFNGDGTISIDPTNGLVRGAAPRSVMTSDPDGSNVDILFYVTSPDAASGDITVNVKLDGGGSTSMLHTSTITPVLGELVSITGLTVTPARKRIDITFQRTGGQSGTYVVHVPVIRPSA